jgi:predicted transcriptional regulator|tara:strand:- start:368 stop:691 length:324 start_codon:yes stop_codon:yes gene_type:complete
MSNTIVEVAVKESHVLILKGKGMNMTDMAKAFGISSNEMRKIYQELGLVKVPDNAVRVVLVRDMDEEMSKLTSHNTNNEVKEEEILEEEATITANGPSMQEVADLVS